MTPPQRRQGGSSYDNQALFDFSGKPLESLEVFGQIYPQTKPELPVEPIQGELIRDLTVKDKDNYGDWHIEKDMHSGMNVYGDRDFMYRNLPEKLIGAEVIQTACDSKNSTSDLAEFTAGADISVYVALDIRVEKTPDWLSDWNETALTADSSNDVTYRLYEKKCKEGEKVTLGSNGQSASCVGYTVFAVEAKAVGDVNSDGEVNVADLVMMQKYLLGDGGLTEWQAGDLCEDGVIDAYDSVAMRKMLINA